MKEKEQHITSIGGQAVMEGVMMRGPKKMAVAVRKPDGEIEIKVDDNGTKKKHALFRLPIVRGCVNFFESMIIGVKALMYSTDFIDLEDDEDTQSKFDQWLEDKFGDKIKDIVVYVSLALSLLLSIVMFILLPTVLTRGLEAVLTGKTFIPAAGWLQSFAATRTFTSLTEGILRMVIFISYLAIVAQMKDIKRVFEYHGAEHKTIACYEAGEALTVENVKKHTRLHPRCGTSFLLFVMIVSIILFALLPRTGIALRMAMRLALLPVVAGISYEIIKLAGRSKNRCVRILTKPGLWLQKLTTREPDESQIEVAIASMNPVIPEDKKRRQMVIREIYHEIRALLNNPREAEMIVSDVLSLSKLDFMMKSRERVEQDKLDTIRSYAKRRAQHEPLQYILGNQEFMSLRFRVCPGVLIPRGDTETLVETVLKRCGKQKTVLDIGTGSGCIPVSIAYYNQDVRVTTVDISDTAMETARENAENNGVADRVCIKKCDIMNEKPDGRFDLIVSNPPYIASAVIAGLDSDVKDHEPRTALDGGKDGLDFYRRIVSLAPSLLKEHGELWFEVGFDQADAVARIMEPYFEEVQKIRDLCGIERVVGGVFNDAADWTEQDV